ncbi:MAG: hypothetical protein K6E97_10710 [Treponema sp.]|nr:hypothetical protein [Treponema sp.]
MKKLIGFTAIIISAVLFFAGCKNENNSIPDTPAEPFTLKVGLYTSELEALIQKYIDTHPDCGFNFEANQLPTITYHDSLSNNLETGEYDIYIVDSAYIGEFLKGDGAQYAMPFAELGITEQEINDAQISPYLLELGKNPQGQLIGLDLYSNICCFAYRRDIARTVFNTDDPSTITEKISPANLSNSIAALKTSGYAFLPSIGDLWQMSKDSVKTNGWVVNNKLYIDEYRMSFFDTAKLYYDSGYINTAFDQWNEEWYEEMKKSGKTFGFLAPLWFLKYTIYLNSTSDPASWGICQAPLSSFWGGNFVLVNNKEMSNSKTKALKDLITWLLLDTSTNGAMSLIANGQINIIDYNCVPSKVVMDNNSYHHPLCGNQNIFEQYATASANSEGLGVIYTEHEVEISNLFIEQVRAYVKGWKTKEKAIADFKLAVATEIGITE